MAWANPSTEDRLPDALFERHEQGTGEVARRLGFSVRAPCPRASRPALEERLPAERPTAIVSLVAHGAEALRQDVNPALQRERTACDRNLSNGFRRGHPTR